MPSFDVFLSYKSDDHAWVKTLAKGLAARGVRVWLDKEQIRPGDLFIHALERGLASSAAVAVVVTKASMTSGWVMEEYNRALQLAVTKGRRLIPLVKESARVPGFLAGREYVDFRDPTAFERQLDALVWPGLTGRRLRCCGVSYDAKSGAPAWRDLLRMASHEGIEFAEVEDIHRAGMFLENHLADLDHRWIVVIDPFEGRPSAREGYVRDSVRRYVQFLLEWRARTKNTPREVVFILFHKAGAWKQVAEARQISGTVRRRLEHYFLLTHDKARSRSSIRRLWNDVQKEAFRAERLALKRRTT